MWLEPAKEGGTARWTGSGRTLSREIAQGILQALRQGAGEHTVMSKRARLEIGQVTQDLPDTNSDGALSMTKNQAGAARLWTFAGTRANRTLARQLQSLAESRRIDAIGIDLKTPIDLSDLSAGLLATALAFSPEEVAELAKPIKFSACLPAALLVQIIQKRQFGL